MALWICDDCTAAYSPGATKCPQCGSTEHTEEGMPKITRHGGASNKANPPTEPEDVPSGETVDTSPASDPSTEEEDSADATSEDPRERYEQDTVDQLRAELKDRGLPTSGTKLELVDRLLADDAEKAAGG